MVAGKWEKYGSVKLGEDFTEADADNMDAYEMETVDNGGLREIFKDTRAYKKTPTLPCYGFTPYDLILCANDILKACKGNRRLADEVFEELNGQHPETVVEQWESEGKITWCLEDGCYYDPQVDCIECPYLKHNKCVQLPGQKTTYLKDLTAPDADEDEDEDNLVLYYDEYRKGKAVRERIQTGFTQWSEVEDWVFKFCEGKHEARLTIPDPSREREPAPIIIQYIWGDGVTFQIHKIVRGDGILFSDGTTTNGQKHWNEEVKQAYRNMLHRKNGRTFNFV